MTDSATDETTPLTDPSGWEKGLDYATKYAPYVTLAIGVVLAFLGREPDQNLLVTTGLVALAGGWIYFMFTLVRGAMGEWQARIYYLGYILICVGLMVYHPLFFVVAIAAFFQVHLLKPPVITFIGVFLASLVVNGLILTDPTSGAIWIYSIVVVVQTLAIGLGVIGSEKMMELNEERRRAVQQLEQALQENEGLHAQLVAQAREAGVSDERQRMAREIHDTIAQGLIGIVTQLEAAGHVIEDRHALERHLESAGRIARESLTEARLAVRAATPLPLKGRQLPEAIGDVVEKWAGDTEVDVEWSTTGDPITLHPEIEVTLLRVVQESLSNVARHAGANRVGVTLSYMGDVVTVDVRDDGVGFTPNGTPREGFGLTSMEARVAALSGSLEVESEPERGTAISVTLPSGEVEDG